MSSNSLWQNIFRLRQEQGNVVGLLAKIPIFRGLKRGELNYVKNLIHLRTYQPDEVIFMEGQPGTGMYLLLSGGVRIVLNYKSENAIELATLKGGDFFGELSLLDESPRSATAVSIGNTELAGFFRSDLMDLVEKSPSLGVKVILALAEVLGERLRATNKELRGLREALLKNKEVDRQVERVLKS
jgi:CRP/FNR family transcriptional regulator, cyclic AMP receptor protein